MDWTTRQLEQLVVVAEEQHVGRAAARLHISQPPLTQAIQRLERTLGVELLDRTGRGIRLTPAGRSFAADAAAILAAGEAAADRARRVAAGLEGAVRIGSIGSLTLGFVPDVLRAAAAELPGVSVELVQGPSRQLVEAVERGELDVAVVRRASVDEADGRHEMHPLHEEQLRLAVPAGHRLAERRRVRMAELEGEPLVALGPPGGRAEEGDALREACAEAGFVPRVVAQAVDLPGLLAWVIAGRALALVPARSEEVAGGGVRLVDVVGGEGLRIRYAAVVRRDRDAVVARVLGIMEAAGAS